MIDVEPNDLSIVKKILAKYVPESEVRVFGSRVKGNARKFSDLDLAIVCDVALDPNLMIDIKNAFDESELPIKVDIHDWRSIGQSFQKIIEEKYEVLQLNNQSD